MIKVQNCSAVGIIYRESRPENVFLEVKTPGYPVLAYVGKGLLPGGNWVRPNAAGDHSPMGTYWREVTEEFTFGNPAVDPEEMDVLFGKGHLGHVTAPRNISPDRKDEPVLAHLVMAIKASAKPWRAFIQNVEREVFDAANPANKMGAYRGLCSVFKVPLKDADWLALSGLQEKYGNLSNESQTVILSADNIIRKNFQIAWGQDRVLQQFFREQGVIKTETIPLMPRAEIAEVPFGASYQEYMKKYHIEKIPEGVARP